MAGRFTSFRRILGFPPVVLLLMFVQYPVDARFGSDIFASIGKNGNDLAGWQALKFGASGRFQDSLAFFFGEFMRWGGSTGIGTLIFLGCSVLTPAFHCSHTQAQFFARKFQSGAFLAGFVNQLYGFGAIKGADQASSPSPQIARAFRRKVSSAAVSARADSFRRNSFSSSLLRFFSVFSSCCSAADCFATPPFA